MRTRGVQSMTGTTLKVSVGQQKARFSLSSSGATSGATSAALRPPRVSSMGHSGRTDHEHLARCLRDQNGGPGTIAGGSASGFSGASARDTDVRARLAIEFDPDLIARSGGATLWKAVRTKRPSPRRRFSSQP